MIWNELVIPLLFAAVAGVSAGAYVAHETDLSMGVAVFFGLASLIVAGVRR